MRGKLIVIEGTDCSGKETQTKKLVERLKENNIQIENYSFPAYDTPTGKIVGGPYLGKSYICEGWFPEGASNVDPKVASLYYAADRKYNIGKINELLEKGINVILDRYVYSNMAHQGGKILDDEKRVEMYNFIETLEFNLLELPQVDIAIFLHMPLNCSKILKQGRVEAADQHEKDDDHLRQAEKVYLELADRYNFSTIECGNDERIKTIDEIHEEVYTIIKDKIN